GQLDAELVAVRAGEGEEDAARLEVVADRFQDGAGWDRLGGSIGDDLDAAEEALEADVADPRIVDAAEGGDQVVAHGGGVGEEVFARDHVEERDPGGAGDGVGGVGGGGAAGEALGGGGGAHHDAEGADAAGDALGGGEDVGGE